MPSPQATAHRDDLGTNACRQAVLPITALAPIALGHRTSMLPPTVDLEITNGREQLPNTPHRGFPHCHGRRIWGLGYARCRCLRPPPDRACRCLSVEPSDRGAPFRTVACCFSDGVVISPAGPCCGERQQIPSPGAGGRQRNCKCQKFQSGMHPPSR